ncbi:hypothetical protein [Paenibacillus naphthalenovorans]|uniref:Uncharacterized protein n=1 Tax=Paenibacillus naphthalenovorans TaxID=162209 RepID=A0A0U2W6R4_9BACL|nr:hypothetical protein [Paenibacillus naphthalenovorans]ALS22126.1 hypothetical protein IJ22_17520 [Paenibacillus naphthalenovorans]
MKFYSTETEILEVPYLDSCVCNKCGDTYTKNKIKDVTSVNAKFVDYGTMYENQIWNFDMCANCLVEIIKTFKYIPTGFMEDYTEASYIKDKQKVFDNWKVTGEWEPYLGYEYEELIGLFDGWYHTAEFINELIEKYYPDKERL